MTDQNNAPEIADALESCDWSGMSIGNQMILRAAIKALRADRAAPDEHLDDMAVDRFATAMKAKLTKKRAEGRGGWDRRDECSAEDLTYMLVQHLWKGDPLDVGNFAMMLHQRGERIMLDGEAKSIAPQPACQQETVLELIGDARLALDTGAISFGETADYRPEDIQAILDILDLALRALKGEHK